jgi:transposase
MANRLKMVKINAIRTLHEQGWSQRRISRELGVDRETVRRYVQAAESNPAIAPSGSEAILPLHLPDGPGRRSNCEPFRDVILSKLEQGLSAQRIYQDLTTEAGFEGSYWSVRWFVNRLGERTPLPFRRMECAPGEEAQVDFGSGAPLITPDGKRKKTWVFRIVLSHSRKAYSEAVPRQTTENFLRCLENAFRCFGGVPQTLVIDNLRAAVSKADWYDPELNPKVQSFCEHYGTVILPTRPYTPRHKEKVESGVKYVKNNALKARTFHTLSEQNQFLNEWERSVADTRIHGTTKRQVQKLFDEAERDRLLPLPVEQFPCFQEGQRSVHRDGHVEVERSYYSVPPKYVTRRVWVRWDSRLVRIFNSRMEQIALHTRDASAPMSNTFPRRRSTAWNAARSGCWGEPV